MEWVQELIQQDTNNKRVIEELRGFRTEASRIGGPPPVATGKRGREEEPATTGDYIGSIPPPTKRADAWNEFESLLKGDFPRSNYGVSL